MNIQFKFENNILKSKVDSQYNYSKDICRTLGNCLEVAMDGYHPRDMFDRIVDIFNEFGEVRSYRRGAIN